MAFKKIKWYKVADNASDLQWTNGGVAEVEADGKKLCIGRVATSPNSPASPGTHSPTTTTSAQSAPNSSGFSNFPETSFQFFGFAHSCPHAGAPMTDAYINAACQITCPVHQLRFNLKNGRDINGEGYILKTYPIETRSDGIFIGMEEGGLFKKWF